MSSKVTELSEIKSHTAVYAKEKTNQNTTTGLTKFLELSKQRNNLLQSTSTKTDEQQYQLRRFQKALSGGFTTINGMALTL